MTRIVEIQNYGHIGLKQYQCSDKWGHKKNSNWYTNPYQLVIPLWRFRFIFKVCVRKEDILIADMWLVVLQAFASPFFKMGSIIGITSDELKAIRQKYFQNVVFLVNDKVVHTGCKCMVHFLFAPCNVKRYAS